MKTRKSKEPKEAVPKKIAETAQSAAPPVEFMRPDQALSAALDEPNRGYLAEYAPAMQVLREKGFSYRGIAEWLNERGLSVDHNEVYRVYRKWAAMNGMPQAMADFDDEKDAREREAGV